MGAVIKVNFENLKPLDYKSREAYKLIRTNVALCGKNIKAIVVTSTTAGEGKTTISFQLAKAMAEAGKKSILVDADLRKSVFSGRYQIDREVRGLTHYLTGMYEKEDIIYRSNITNLSVVFAGPNAPNPVELLAGDKWKTLITDLKGNYDYVIIDSPPLGKVIDGAVLAATCDGAIIVVEANSYHHNLVKEVKKQLEKAGCSIIGAILNKADDYENGYQYNYYNKYGKQYT